MNRRYNLRQTARPNLASLIASLKDEISLEQVAVKLDLPNKLAMQKIGTSLQGNCPTGHPSKGGRCFSIDTTDNLFHCFHCNEAGDIVSLVALVQKCSTVEATNWLVQEFAPHLATQLNEMADNLPPEQKQFYQRASLYKMIFEEGQKLLYQPAGKVALDYLVKERGYDLNLLPKTDFIFWDTEKNIRAHLLKKAPDLKDQINALPLLGARGDKFRLAIPFRDRNGAITGYLKRAHTKAGFTVDGEHVRWDSTSGLTKPDLFGLNRIRNEETLIVVEGYPDATYLPVLGLTNIVAVGQAAFSEKYIEGLVAKNIKRIILALDNDLGEPTGIKNSEAICELFAGSDIQVFVVDPTLFGMQKDPDEYVMANGIDAFKKLVEKAESSGTWMTKRILSKHNLATDVGKSTAIGEALEFADTLGNAVEAEAITRALVAQFGLTPETLEAEFKRMQEKNASERLADGVSAVTREVQKLQRDGNAEKAASVLENEVQEILSDFRSTKVVPQLPLVDFLKEKKQSDSQRKQGQRIGYKLDTFSSVDSMLSGLQSGLYIIGADPNIGKTALMVSLNIDVLKSNPDVHTLFFTMDDSRDMIVSRVLAHRTDKEINAVRFKQPSPADEKTIDDAYLELEQWAKTGRLDVRELTDYFSMRSILDLVRNHRKRDKLVVFIDGIYNVPLDTDYGSLREENIERANQIKQLVKLYKVPVISTAEYRKKTSEEARTKKSGRTIHDIMETGKYGYNADVVWLLSPKDEDRYRTEDTPVILMEFGKNKLSSFRGTMELEFTRAKSVMTPVAVSPSNNNPF